MRDIINNETLKANDAVQWIHENQKTKKEKNIFYLPLSESTWMTSIYNSLFDGHSLTYEWTDEVVRSTSFAYKFSTASVRSKLRKMFNSCITYTIHSTQYRVHYKSNMHACDIVIYSTTSNVLYCFVVCVCATELYWLHKYLMTVPKKAAIPLLLSQRLLQFAFFLLLLRFVYYKVFLFISSFFSILFPFFRW